jgi:flavodoxin/ferredoxin
MKAIIVYFSPSGGTKKIAQQIEETHKNIFEKIESVNLTHNESYWNSQQFRNNLFNIINEYDVLFVGSPVYAHHLHYNMCDFIKQLLPLNKIQFAIPFITFGGINSGEGLHDAEKLLRKAGRKVFAGIKINSEHCLSKGFNTDFNRGLPAEIALPILTELSEKLSKLQQNHNIRIPDNNFLNYQKLAVRLRTKLLIGEKFWHKHMYPKQSFDYSKCNQCGLCEKKCPLLRIELQGGNPLIKANAKDCIHCGTCVFSCKTGGSYFDADMIKWEKLFIKATLGKGPLVSNEEPKTKIYYAKTN